MRASPPFLSSSSLASFLSVRYHSLDSMARKRAEGETKRMADAHIREGRRNRLSRRRRQYHKRLNPTASSFILAKRLSLAAKWTSMRVCMAGTDNYSIRADRMITAHAANESAERGEQHLLLLRLGADGQDSIVGRSIESRRFLTLPSCWQLF